MLYVACAHRHFSLQCRLQACNVPPAQAELVQEDPADGGIALHSVHNSGALKRRVRGRKNSGGYKGILQQAA